MRFNKEDARRNLYSGLNKGYSHLVILVDKWDYDYLPLFINEGESIDDVLSKYLYPNTLWAIVEIYNYKIDLEFQLNEEIAMHKESNTQRLNTIFDNLSSKVEEKDALLELIFNIFKPSQEEKEFFDMFEAHLKDRQKSLKK